ncbi:MAG: D-alanyl-D-alanine carboxypeptidase [Ginsengibacter sp.]
MKKYFLFLISLSSLLLTSCSVSKKINLAAKKDLLRNESFISAHTGISIYEPASGKYWYNYQGDKYFTPASNTKLATCYVAMKYLGDSLVGISYQEEGDSLFIFPAGDPSFLHPDFKTNPVYNFLEHTNKKIVVNTSSWQEQRWGSGWAWNDYNDDYSAERSVMPVYGNVARFDNQAGSLQIFPSYFSKTTFIDSIYNRHNFSNTVYREIASNKFFIKDLHSSFNDLEVPFYTEDDSILINLLEDTLHKTVYRSSYLKNKSDNNKIYSQATDSVLKPMMHRSDNFFAEQNLLMVSNKLLGVMSDGKIIDTLLKTDFNDLPQKPGWVDGSGLSRFDLFSPQDMVTILNKMKNEFGMKRIENILATGGTGTLRSLYKKDSGFIFAKTGTLSGVVALSGFLYTRKNKLLIFSVLVNNHRSSAANIRKAIEKFILAVRYKN